MSEPAPIRPAFASGWQRFWAMNIDMILLSILMVFIAYTCTDYFWYCAVSSSVTLFYFLLPEACWRLGSPGKILMGLYLCDATGGKLSLGRVFMRLGLQFLPTLPMAYFGVCSPEFVSFMQAVQHKAPPETVLPLMRTPPVQHIMMLILWSGLVGTIGSFLFFWLPTFFTKERIALHDWLTGARVCHAVSKLKLRPSIQIASGWQRFGAGLIDIIFGVIVGRVLHIFLPAVSGSVLFGLAYGACYFIVLECSKWQATLGKRLVGIYVAPLRDTKMLWQKIVLRYLVLAAPALPMYGMLIFSKLPEIQKNIAAHHGDASYLRHYMAEGDNVHVLTNFGIAVIAALCLQTALIYIPLLASREKTGLHDMLSGTRVYVGKPVTMTAGQDGPHAAA